MAKGTAKTTTGANLGFEAKLWTAADKLRSNMDAAEYKHVVLGLIFLKYISDSFGEHHQELLKDPMANPEDKDEYTAANIFWVPAEARWSFLQGKAHTTEIGKLIDEAMDAIEKDNKRLKNILPKNYARPDLDKAKLGELIDLIGTIGLGDKENRSKDILGRVYEYFLSEFASAEGKQGGQFYTPRCIVQLLVSMLAPLPGKRIYDPCCGSGGMFVQSEKFVEEHGGKIGDISIFGQESNPTTWRLAKMNLAIRGIEADLGQENADSFLKDLHKDRQFDFVIANPPFNMKEWGGEQLKKDARWQYGIPPEGNANYAWIQHFIRHLSPNGLAGFVLANGSMSSQQSGEGEIRKAIIEADMVDCMVALPGQLFYSTQIPACLWFLTRSKTGGKYRDRRGETLFIDARNLGVLKDRVHKELTAEDVAKIATTYHAWRGDNTTPRHSSPPRHSSEGWNPEQEKELDTVLQRYDEYKDIPGFCKAVTTAEIAAQNYILTPGRYVGMAPKENEDTEPFQDKMKRLTAELYAQFEESARLEKEIKANLIKLGFGEDK
ncbi:MAG: N-6 DNA methylase [Candidatus Cloacimonetes bacterium HGW-Cloacimonetes-3]|jgi:type I restriction enzyme M protein|nr:MAG: N-6 DNA methylase [Candidatus Cloacimonetes bacterium HGW-Cloacimonetes-3]